MPTASTREEEFRGILEQIGNENEIPPDLTEENENAASTETVLETSEPELIEPETEEPPQGIQLTMKKVFRSPDVHPIILAGLLLNKFGPDWISWEPETIWLEIYSEFGENSISIITKNKINAIKTLHLVNTPWEDWGTFTLVAQALNGKIPNFKIFIKPSPDELISAVGIMDKIRKHDFNEEVARFIAACFLDEGIYCLPPPLEFAQIYAAKPYYVCKECHNIDVDEDNNMCDSCGAPQSSLEKKFKFDFASVLKRYNAALKAGKDRDFVLEENEIDIQVAKLLRARMFDEEMDNLLVQQARQLDV